MIHLRSKFIILLALSWLTLPLISVAINLTHSTSTCPDPTTTCPKTMSEANSCNWQTLPGFPIPTDPLNYQSGPISGYGYKSVCVYTSNQVPYYTGLYYAGSIKR